MILPVYLYGHPVLRKIAEEVTPDFPNLKQLIDNMKETMYASDGIGIAAPQVGVSARIIYIDADVLNDTFPELKDVKLVLINPTVEIIADGKQMTREEGCLSLPGIHESVSRTEKVKLSWYDENFDSHSQVFEGYLARVIQHENDHLDGKVFIDHISPIRKQLIRNKLHNIIAGKVRCDYRTKACKR